MRLLIQTSIFCLLSLTSIAQAISKDTLKRKPFILGESVEIASKILGEKRVLNIYTPANYKKTDTTKYHVIYLLDGSADEDFIHIAGLVQFNTFPWIELLPPTIVVGIGNTDRRRDFTFPSTITKEKEKYPTAGKSKQFIDFIQYELQPFIDSNYKTGTDKTIIGQSLGGLLVSEILLKRPQLFNKYIIISPSLWWDNGSLLKYTTESLSGNLKSKTDVYVGVGKEGLAPSIEPHVMEVDANLFAEKLKLVKNKAMSVVFDYLPDEDHATITHQAVFNAFRLLFKKKS